MESLPQKKIVVLGGSRGVGRVIVQTLNAAGAEVLAVARNTDALTVLKREQPEVETLCLDVTDERAPEGVFGGIEAEVLVICAGAQRTGSSCYELGVAELAAS